MYCCLSGMPASGKFSNSHCQRSANYIIRFVKIGALKICSNFRSKSTKEKLEENYSTELMVLSVYLISI